MIVAAAIVSPRRAGRLGPVLAGVAGARGIVTAYDALAAVGVEDDPQHLQAGDDLRAASRARRRSIE
jgi:hypothetical protein